MQLRFLSLTAFALCAFTSLAQETYTFSNADGKTLEDRIVKFNFEERIVTLDKKGNVDLDNFSETDQAHILRWNQIKGFKSIMRFKMGIQKDTWARMKHERNVTPYFLEAIQIPGKKTPNHNIIIVDDYEEYNVVYLEAEGYSITLRNQNSFPLENLVVESKIFYEQELYLITDSLFVSSEQDYTKTVTTNKVRFLSETIPLIIPREEVVINSECAIIVDHQVERNALIYESEEGEEGDEESDDTETVIEGFGDWDDHSRRRKGRVNGAWFRVGMKDLNGGMVWRELASPPSISEKFSWDPEPVDSETL